MSRREWIQFGREFLTVAVTTSLLIGPAGCRLQALPGNGGGGGGIPLDLTKLNGLMINESVADGVIMAARNAAGDAFFVFGTRDALGGLQEVEQILVRTADGAESFIAFESGRPVHAEGPAGDYVHITYTEVSAERLAATVDVFSAAAGQVDSYEVDLDLQVAAQQIAETIRDLTGQEVPVTTFEDGQLKSGPEQTRITFISPLFAAVVLPFVFLVQLVTVILGQIFQLIHDVAEAILILALSPFFLVTELLSSSIVNIRVVPLFEAFTIVPPPATIVLLDD